MALLTSSYQRLSPPSASWKMISIFTLSLFLIGTPAGSATGSPIASTALVANDREYQIKAVFLLNFARFVAWPTDAFASDSAPLELGVLGDDPFGNYLDDAVRGETVNRRPISVHRFQRVEDVTHCHVLFICRSETANLERILDRLNGRKILTVGDSENFADMGGIIGFVRHNDKVRLQINLDAAKGSQLTISAKLLRPSEIVGNWKKRQLRLYDRSRFPWGSEAGGHTVDPTLRYAMKPAGSKPLVGS